MITEEFITYQDQSVSLEGFCAKPQHLTQATPAILISHDWSGRNEFVCHKARQFAELGYIAFACDVYGKGKFGTTTEEKSALMQPLIQDRPSLQRRMQLGLDALVKIEHVDQQRIAAMGYCFGGLCVLDLARTGAPLTAVIAIHAVLLPPDNLGAEKIHGQVLALHGYKDPMVKPEQVFRFTSELDQANVKWEMIIYGQALHAFTNPKANDHELGTVYNENADRRSWRDILAFLEEVLA